MTAEDSVGKKISPQENLSEEQKKLKTIIRLTFKFTQGNIFRQLNIYRWLKQNHHLDTFTISKNLPDHIASLKVPEEHTHDFTESDRLNQVKASWKVLYEVTNRQDSISETALLADFVNGDIEYQRRERPNRSPNADTEPDSVHDPYASLLRKHCLDAAPTGSEVFDKLCANLRPLLIEALSAEASDDNPLRERVTTLRNLWEQNHIRYDLLLDRTYTPPKFYKGDH